MKRNDDIRSGSNFNPRDATAEELVEEIYQRSMEALQKGEKDTALDTQEGGDHYKKTVIQPIEYITANNLGFIEGNIVKYITRHEDKNGIEDINKIIHYCELLKELKYSEYKI